MGTTKSESVADDIKERRRRWEGIYDDEAAQARLPFEAPILKVKDRDSEKMSPMEWLFSILGCLGGTALLITILCRYIN